MAQEVETDNFQELEKMYRQLLQISQDQKALIDDMAEDELLSDRFRELIYKWNKITSDATILSGELRTGVGTQIFNKYFTSVILPIIEQIYTNMNQTEEQVQQSILKTGTSIIGINKRRNVRKAYTDYGNAQALFFDEKK